MVLIISKSDVSQPLIFFAISFLQSVGLAILIQQNQSIDAVWIGLNNLSGGPYQWADGSTVNYNNTCPGWRGNLISGISF